MEKCEQCGGRVRFSRAQQLLECMECGALYAPSAAMIIGPSAQPSESTEAHRLELEADGAAIKDPPVPKGYVATCPSGFSILNESATNLELEILKKAKAGCFLSFFTVAWNLFMVVWFTIALTSGQWAMVAFGSIHGLVGLFLIFITLSSLINRQFFFLDSDRVMVQSKPVSISRMLGSVEIKRANTAQIFLTDYGSFHTVMALLRDGSERPLANHLTWEEARYLEQQIEELWEIADNPSADRRVERSHIDDDDDGYDDHFDFYDD